MCGISGFIDFKNNTDKEILLSMVKALSHRGPDDSGAEIFDLDTATVGLGQARLSIIDLSHNGHQPMHYKQYSIVFNGEVYNYKEIKLELLQLNHEFISDSDTEVILHAFDAWGDAAVHKFIGMFAIVILDKIKNEISIVRDRAGVKPLFYYWKNDLFLFASELKSFHKHPDFDKEIDEKALKLYFDFGYVPSPYSIFKDCFKIEPGSIAKINLTNKKIEHRIYWNVDDYYKKEKSKLTYQEAKSDLKDLLKSACDYRMVADVPVGVFLSGGFDSSLVTAILQKDSIEKIKTFTIGFETGNNEADYAKEVAKYLGTEHTEYICTFKDAEKIIPDLTYFFDEPFSDSSAIPTILVSSLAVKKVKVALSADAGDEVFGGYSRYFSLRDKLHTLNRIPNGLHKITKLTLDSLVTCIPETKIDLTHKMQGFAKSLNSDKNLQSSTIFKSMSSLPNYYSNSIFKQKIEDYPTVFENDYGKVKNDIEIAMLIDYKMYLQNDILAKVDRAAMSVSLEGREPLLDHRLIEYAATLPLEYKIQGNSGKRILKDIVYDYIPKQIMDRPKAGFSVPIDYWLKNELSYLIDENLNEKALSISGLFNVPFVLEIVKSYKNDSLHYKTLIWKLIVFQMWYFKWLK
jgi:asparagine synthase (glutamine-hydrolysing)